MLKGGILGNVEYSRKGEKGYPQMLENTGMKGHFLIKAWSFLLGGKDTYLKGKSPLFYLHIPGQGQHSWTELDWF